MSPLKEQEACAFARPSVEPGSHSPILPTDDTWICIRLPHRTINAPHVDGLTIGVMPAHRKGPQPAGLCPAIP